MRFGSLLRVRLLGLHPFTWLAGLVVGLALVLIMVPGEVWDWRHQGDTWDARECEKAVFSAIDRYRGRAFFSTPDVCVYVHGWPMPCAVRARGPILDSTVDERSEPKLRFAASAWTPLYEPDPGAISWSNYDNWPFHSDELRVRPLGIFVNSLAGLFVLGFVLSGCEWWLRRRGGVLRFRVADLLIVVAFGAVAFGWYGYHIRIQRNEKNVAAEFVERGEGQSSIHAKFCYTGPRWLAKLVGSEHLPDFLWHVEMVSFHNVFAEFGDIDRLTRFPDLERISFGDGISPAAAARLHGCDGLKEVSLSPKQNFDWVYGKVEGECPSVEVLAELRTLKLDTLTLKGSVFTDTHIEQLSPTQYLRELQLVDAGVSDEHIERFREQNPRCKVTHFRFRDDW